MGNVIAEDRLFSVLFLISVWIRGLDSDPYFCKERIPNYVDTFDTTSCCDVIVFLIQLLRFFVGIGAGETEDGKI